MTHPCEPTAGEELGGGVPSTPAAYLGVYVRRGKGGKGKPALYSMPEAGEEGLVQVHCANPMAQPVPAGER
jgi:hypothetical protein